MKDENSEELVGRRLKAYDEIIENRRYRIAQLYGRMAAERYTPLRREREYFGWHGHLPDQAPFSLEAEAATTNSRVQELHAEFFAYCEEHHAVERQQHEDRIAERRKVWEASPMYEAQAPQRAAFVQYYEALGAKWKANAQ